MFSQGVIQQEIAVLIWQVETASFRFQSLTVPSLLPKSETLILNNQQLCDEASLKQMALYLLKFSMNLGGGNNLF